MVHVYGFGQCLRGGRMGVASTINRIDLLSPPRESNLADHGLADRAGNAGNFVVEHTKCHKSAPVHFGNKEGRHITVWVAVRQRPLQIFPLARDQPVYLTKKGPRG